jgi:carbamoyl-phosphate synthase large subunit
LALLINTPLGKQSQYDDYTARRAAIAYKVPYITTMSPAEAAVDAISALRSRRREVKSIQERTGHWFPAGRGRDDEQAAC